MGTTVVGGREHCCDVGELVVYDSVVGVGKPHPLLFALVGTDHANQIVIFEERLHCSVSVEIGTTTRRVGHEVKFKKLQTQHREVLTQVS